MKAMQHIKIANIMLNRLNGKLKNGLTVHKLAYYIGSVAPDLNCIYPAHRLTDTSNRFQKKVKRAYNMNDNIVRSFTLGVITHYVCDYFCFAHNNRSVGIKHKKYETGLNHYFELHKNMFVDKDIIVEWEKAKKIINEKFDLDTNAVDMDLHADMILEQLKILNSNYNEKSKDTYAEFWTVCKEQWERDLEYSITVCENILELIVEPVRCVSSAYN